MRSRRVGVISMATAVCLTGLWRTGTELDRCRNDFLSTCLYGVHPVFRVGSQHNMTNFTSTQHQALQLQQCDNMISRSPFATSIVRVLRIRPDTITYAIPLWQLPNLLNVVYTYAPFWKGALENEKVKLNDVFMLFHRATFRRLVQGDPWPVVGQREARQICNFTQRVPYEGSFECALHVQAHRKNLTINWRRAGQHPRDVLQYATSPNASHTRARLSARCMCKRIGTRVMQNAPPASTSLAVLLAGQVRTLSEPAVLDNLRRDIVQHMGAIVFAHVSIEHTYSWHLHLANMSTRWKATDSGTHPRVDAIKRALMPVYMRVESDLDIVGHPKWAGSLHGQPGEADTLFFRWLLLRDALVSEEAVRGTRFAFVLRLRPDLVMRCRLSRDPTLWMGRFHAVQDADLAMLMRREAAQLALGIYTRAEKLPACLLKVELCVPALLAASGFAVAEVNGNFTAIVRSQAFCDGPVATAIQAKNMKCGRAFVGGSAKPWCSSTPLQAWAISRHVEKWMQLMNKTHSQLRRPASELPFSKFCRSCSALRQKSQQNLTLAGRS